MLCPAPLCRVDQHQFGIFQRGFIKAETIDYDSYVALGGEQGAKDAGKMRQEGKEYFVRDGDIFHFRFNV